MSRYLQFESQYGDLASIIKTDRRISSLCSEVLKNQMCCWLCFLVMHILFFAWYIYKLNGLIQEK